MGANISRRCFDYFQIINELYISMAAGIGGLFILALGGATSAPGTFQTVAVTFLTLVGLLYLYQTRGKATPSRNKVVLITGCDSGLGFSMAQHACDLGFSVVAGCLNLESEGSLELEKLYGRKIRRVQINVTDTERITKVVQMVSGLLAEDPENGKIFLQFSNTFSK